MRQFLTLCLLCFLSITIQAQITSGLVAYYPFSGDATDAAGTVDGMVTNATLTSDRFGTANSAYAFTSSGSNYSYVDLGNNFNTVLSGATAQFSISLWFKRSGAGQKITLFSKHANSVYCGSNDQQFAVLLNPDGTLQANYYEGTIATNYVITTNQINDEDWHHLVFTYDATIGTGQNRATFYVDNTVWAHTLSNNGADVTAIVANNAHASIGHVLSVTGAPCNISTYGSNGSIDDIRLYDRIVSVCDVSDLFVEGDSADGMVAHYPFLGDAMDAIGTVNGTVTNATLTSDRFGIANSAYAFTSSGSNYSYVGLGNNFNTVLAGANAKFSISLWFKRSGIGQKMTLFSKHANSVYCGSNDQQFALILNPNGSLQANYYENTTAANYALTTSQISDENWHHLVVTYDATIGAGQNRMTFYVDNTVWSYGLTNSNGTDVTTIVANNAHASIGHVLSTTGIPCNISTYGSNGSMDDVRLYDRIVSVCDVDSLYTPNSTIAINQINDLEADLKLYPNPVDDILHLDLELTTSVNDELNVQIINVTGQVLKSEVLKSDGMAIGTKELVTGIYFVKVLDGTKTIASQKMIKY